MKIMKLKDVAAVVIIALAALLGCSAPGGVLLQLAVRSAPPASGDALRGEQIFRAGVAGAPPCSACHQVVEGNTGFSLAPNLSGIAARAAGRVTGMGARQYLEDSILHPQHHVVAGYHVSMFADYASYLSRQDLADLIAYLMTLQGAGAGN